MVHRHFCYRMKLASLRFSDKDNLLWMWRCTMYGTCVFDLLTQSLSDFTRFIFFAIKKAKKRQNALKNKSSMFNTHTHTTWISATSHGSTFLVAWSASAHSLLPFSSLYNNTMCALFMEVHRFFCCFFHLCSGKKSGNENELNVTCPVLQVITLIITINVLLRR